MSSEHMHFEKLPPELKRLKYQVRWFAREICGLEVKDHNGNEIEVIFEMCDTEDLYALASYGGFPVRYPHYQFGLEFNEMMASHTYGLSRIYEMVINNNPCYAYLLKENGFVDHKLVMIHVYGHADFFFNNEYFRSTNKKAIDMMANHGQRIRRFADLHGAEEVEKWLDVVRSLSNLIDPDQDAILRVDEKKNGILDKPEKEDEPWSGRFEASSYMDEVINPQEEIDRVKNRNDAKKKVDVEKRKTLLFPAEPVRDVMGFIAACAPLEDWKREIIWMLRDEELYFVPQAKTKIMNEGWASLWHSIGMTQLCAASEIIHYAEHNAGTLAASPNRLNPYRLGKAIWLDIWYRWDTHRRGKIYHKCDLLDVRDNWDAFVAFFNIHLKYKDDAVAFDLAWQEFLYFWHRLKDGAIGISKHFFDPQKLLLWWSQYLDIGNKLHEERMRLLTNTDEILNIRQRLADIGDSEISSDVEVAVKFWTEGVTSSFKVAKITREIREDLAGFISDMVLKLEERLSFWDESIRPHLEGRVRLLSALEKIREEFRGGAKAPRNFFITPSSFALWADENALEGELPIGIGREKIFEVRKVHCDMTFIDNFLTLEEALAQQLFQFTYNEANDTYEIASRQFEEVKSALVTNLSNYRPKIFVKDANFKNKGYLLLEHADTGSELKALEAQKTLENLFAVWCRPVFISTIQEEKRVIVGFDGAKHFGNPS